MEEWVHSKFVNEIEDECQNFIFLKDGSMKYDFDKFDDYIDAMIDAINHGEDIDRVISLIFREKIDQPIIKAKILKIINSGTNV